MQENDLVQIFSAVCAYIADNMVDLLTPHLGDKQEMIRPLFEDAHITHIDDWWNNKMSNHFVEYMAQIASFRKDNPSATQENIDMGIKEIQESDVLWEQFRAMDDGSPQSQIEILKHVPHNAQYASELTQTDGYKALDRICEGIGNVIVWPMVTVNTDATDLKSAFYLNAAIVSTDGVPLKKKLENYTPKPLI